MVYSRAGEPESESDRPETHDLARAGAGAGAILKIGMEPELKSELA